MATIRSRLDKVAKQWQALQAARDARAVAILHQAGASADVDPSQWPQNVHDGLAEWGWSTRQAVDLLQRWQAELDKDTVLVIRWADGETWNGIDEAPLLVIRPDLLDALAPDGTTPDVTDRLQPDTPDDKVTTPYVYQPQPRPRKLFPHEQAERQRNRRPNWRTR